jgi:uncharacterized protein YcaQ
MPSSIPPSEISISKQQARQFLVTHHRLLPPRKLLGKQGVIDYVRHVNCIQYDPINVVGQNPHLVLQSRIKGYKPSMLDEVLYADRKLIDGYDKEMSIFPVEDWPYFHRYRKHWGGLYAGDESTVKAAKLMEWVKKEIRSRGPLSSLDLEEETRMDWWLSGSTRAARIALDILFVSGDVSVHHRVGTRRYFDLSKRLLPKKYHKGLHLHAGAQSYMDWHVLRRIGSLGLARYVNGGQWGGMDGAEARAPIAERPFFTFCRWVILRVWRLKAWRNRKSISNGPNCQDWIAENPGVDFTPHLLHRSII